LPFAKAAVDVRVTNSFSSQSVGDSSYTVSITKHLQKAEQAKFCGPSISTTSTFVNGEMVVRALNESNTLLIPFIVDPFGGLGPIANRFLFSLRPDPAPDPLHFHSATCLSRSIQATTPCPRPHQPVSHTVPTNIGHATRPTSPLETHTIPGFQQTGSDSRLLVPTSI
jgi:hypothetical protein